MPVPCGGDVVGRWIDFVQQRQSLGGPLLLEGFGDEVQPRPGVLRIAREGLAQQRVSAVS